jgi:hypothetical protein
MQNLYYFCAILTVNRNRPQIFVKLSLLLASCWFLDSLTHKKLREWRYVPKRRLTFIGLHCVIS